MKIKKNGIIALFTGLVGALLAAFLYMAIPTVEITPGQNDVGVALGSSIAIESSPLAKIGKVAVYADDQLLAMEYNLGSGSLSRDFGLEPGRQVRVETKVASFIGLTREFSATFTTVAPLKVESMSVDGERYSPGDKIPPGAALSFSFSKPVAQAAVSLNGSDPIGLEINPDDPATATLTPVDTLKQGESHLLKITSTATDSTVLDPKEIRVNVVAPLSLYGWVDDSGDVVKIELAANTRFADPAAVEAALETTLPQAETSVEPQKIIISCPGLDRAAEYSIKLNNAAGADGSVLDVPLDMTLSFRSDQGPMTVTGTSGYRNYSNTSGGTSGGSSIPSAPGIGGSGPPPGWPDCCPWPPE